MKLIEDSGKITAAINAIAKSGNKLDLDIQLVGLSVLNHAELHGDVTLINKLYLALPRGTRKTAMTQWLVAFGKVVANTGDNKKEAPFSYDKTKATDLAGASQTPWFDFAPDKAPDALFDVQAAVASLLRRASKADKVSDPELIAKLSQLVNAE